MVLLLSLDPCPVQLQDGASYSGHEDMREQLQSPGVGQVFQLVEPRRLAPCVLLHGPAGAMSSQGECRSRMQGRSVGARAHSYADGKEPPGRRLPHALQIRLQRSQRSSGGVHYFHALLHCLLATLCPLGTRREILTPLSDSAADYQLVRRAHATLR